MENTIPRRKKQQKQLTGTHLTPAQQSEVAKMLQSTINRNIEPKMTTYGGSYSVGFSGTVFSITSALTRGDLALNQFQGNIIKPRMLRVRGSWGTNQTYSTVRTLVFQWKDATYPTASGILQFTSQVYSPYSPLLWENRRKIRVLYDMTHSLKPRVASGYDYESFDSGALINLADIQFAAGSASVQMNGLFVLVISDDGAASYPFINYCVELVYTDA